MISNYIETLRKSIGHAPVLQCGASTICVNKKNEVLLIKRRDNGCWGLPGGAVELDEIVEETAKRELFEETGLTAKSLELFGIYSGKDMHYIYPNGDEVSNAGPVYICRDFSGELKPEQSEVSELRFFAPDEFPDNISPPDRRPLNDYINHLKTLVDTCNKRYNADVSIITYEKKYHDDMLFCYLSAKDAVGKYAPDGKWKRPVIKEDILNIEKHYLSCGDIFYLAIDKRDRVVGMVGTHTESPTDIWLKRLFVKPEVKGKGIGSKLLAAVEMFAAEKGINAIHTRFAHWYREAAHFYPAKGFVEAEPYEHMRHMVKHL